MAKSINYVITGIWYTEHESSKYISHVMLHKHNISASIIQPGEKTSKEKVIELIESLDTNKIVCCTATYNNSECHWTIHAEAEVIVEYTETGKFLKTTADSTEIDNLSRLIPMKIFPIRD